jgi:phosphate transport system substrate-binding protein
MMSQMAWRKCVVLFLIALCITLISCSFQSVMSPGTLHIKGSDTMRILTERWAEEYMKVHPNVSVYAEGGGTATGITALIDGSTHICAASRPLKPNEVQQLARKYNRLGVATLVAKDALSVYVNAANPVQDLTLEQVKQIFIGKIRTWDQLGGTSDSIVVLVRAPNSGTYLYFKEHILTDEPYLPTAETLPSTQSIIREITANRNAIGYGGIAYNQPGMVDCRINGITPNEESVRNDTYPIVRYLYLYTIDTPYGLVGDFIDWVLSDGQRIVKDVGYVSLWDNR